MAVIHKGKCDPRKKLRRTAVLLTLCWPVALCALALTAAFYWLGWERLLSLAQGWRRGFMAWALQPGAGVDGTQEWLQTLWHAAETALTGVGWGLYGARCAEFLFGKKVWRFFAAAQIAVIILSAGMDTATVWQLAETGNGLMVIPNLITLAALGQEVVGLTESFRAKNNGIPHHRFD